ncbi:MAG: aminotransferase class III-fold pyridoxal phosphate-dependent enzyme [Fimbriimonadaceae bacterium]
MEPLLPGALHVGPPGWKHCAHGCGGLCRNRCLGELALLMEREGDIAAVVAEPVRCTTVEEPPEGYWRSVRELCDRHSALLIIDEIPLSLGRTGDWTACDTYGVEPDILVLGKGLGAGVFPLACMAARIEYDRFGHVALGHFTHEKTPLGCAAGLALLEVLEAEHLVSRSDALGRKFRQRLLSDLAQNRGVRAVRGTGLLTGVELEAGNRTADACEEILYGCLSDGLSFKVSDGRVLTLTPPLNILESELDEAAQIVASNVKKALGST